MRCWGTDPLPRFRARLPTGPGLGGPWVATEKIHGAQLVVACDGERVRIGKRKAWLDDDEPFFGWQLLRANLDQAIRAIHAELDGAEVHLYGELFGGAYPHPEVPTLPGLEPVQTGIWYAPSLCFAAFALVEVPRDPEAEIEIASHSELEDLAAGVELDTVPVLARGTRQVLTQLPVRYPTGVPERLGLPPLADNVAEGFVLCPDLRMPAAVRPVVKHKIPEFDEARFDQSIAFDSTVHLSIDELLAWAAQMTNAMRVASARSKVGTEPEAVIDEVALDVWVDLEDLFPRRMSQLAMDEEPKLREGLMRLAHEALTR